MAWQETGNPTGEQDKLSELCCVESIIANKQDFRCAAPMIGVKKGAGFVLKRRLIT